MLDYPTSSIWLSTWSIFLARWVKGVILSHFYYLHFFTRALLHCSCLKVIGGKWAGGYVVGWVAQAQGPNPFFFFFWGDFYSTWGPVGIRAWTRIWTRAWQYPWIIVHSLTLCEIHMLPSLDWTSYRCALSPQPELRPQFYQKSPQWCPDLPAEVLLLYLLCQCNSAWV